MIITEIEYITKHTNNTSITMVSMIAGEKLLPVLLEVQKNT